MSCDRETRSGALSSVWYNYRRGLRSRAKKARSPICSTLGPQLGAIRCRTSKAEAKETVTGAVYLNGIWTPTTTSFSLFSLLGQEVNSCILLQAPPCCAAQKQCGVDWPQTKTWHLQNCESNKLFLHLNNLRYLLQHHNADWHNMGTLGSARWGLGSPHPSLHIPYYIYNTPLSTTCDIAG